MAATAVGLHLRCTWGRWLAIGVFTANGLGDAARGITGAVLDGLIGVAIASALVWWLTRPSVQAQFGRPAVGGAPWLS